MIPLNEEKLKNLISIKFYFSVKFLVLKLILKNKKTPTSYTEAEVIFRGSTLFICK